MAPNPLLASRLRQPRTASMTREDTLDEMLKKRATDTPDTFPNSSNTLDLLDALNGNSSSPSGGSSSPGGSNAMDVLRMRNMAGGGNVPMQGDFMSGGSQPGQGWSGSTFTPAGGAAAGGATGLGPGATMTSMYGLPAAGSSSLAGTTGGGATGGAGGAAGLGGAAMIAAPLALFAGGMALGLWRANKHKKFLSNKHANQTDEEKRQELANSLAFNSDPEVIAEQKRRNRQDLE